MCEVDEIRCTWWVPDKCSVIIFPIQKVLGERQGMMWVCRATGVNGTGMPLSFKAVRVGGVGGLHTEPRLGCFLLC